MTNEITNQENQQIQIMPKSSDDVLNIARIISRGGFAPKGNDRPEQIIAAIHKGLEVGIAPMSAVQQISVINGKPSLWGDSMVALVQASGLLEDFQEQITGQGDVMEARCTVKRKGLETSKSATFSVEDAKTAGLWGKAGPWRSYPRRMLQLRARGYALRDSFADILNGLQSAEEQSDIIDAAFEEAKQKTDNAPVAVSLDLNGAPDQSPAPVLDADADNPPPPPAPNNAPGNTDEMMLFSDAEAAAKQGMDSYQGFFSGLTNDQRRALHGDGSESSMHSICREIAERSE